jgi:hypothetical protein
MSNPGRRRERKSFDQLLADNESEVGTVIDKSETDDNSTTTKVEMIPLSDVKLNFKNKRVITQLIRFIPDDLAAEALTKSSPNKHIIANIHKISINNIQSEFKKASDGDPILDYPNHSDLYDIEGEGIFIGKGICFSNIKSSDKNITKIIDDFVERVIRHGNSLAANTDVVEKPQIVQTGGQRFKIIYGHQRYTYLVFYYGLAYVYNFNLSLSETRQDLKIFLENNSKTTETGYEQLLSSFYTVIDLGLTDSEAIMKNLSISSSRYYQIKPFLEDKHLLSIVKDAGITLSLKLLIEAYKQVKNALKALGITDKEELYSRFEEKLLVLSKKNKKVSTPKNSISLSLPKSTSLIEKLLFTDVRELEGFDINDYDLTDSKSIKKLFMKVIEISNDN